MSDDSAIIDIEGEVACLKSGQDEEHLTHPSAVPSAKQLRPFKILRIKSSDALLALDIVDTADIIKDYQVPIVGGPRYTEEAILYIDEIGRGSTSKVYKCIYVPTLSFVAVSTNSNSMHQSV